MNICELRMKYKAETSFSAEPMTVYARIGSHGDIILNQVEINERIVSMLDPYGKQREISFPDPDYCKWLEEKLIELL